MQTKMILQRSMMNNPRFTILVDMDGVLENLGEVWAEIINEKFGTNVSYENLTEWDMQKNFPDVPVEEITSILDLPGLWERLTPSPNADYYLQKLLDDGHKIVIVTASHFNSLKIKLENCLFKYYPFLSYKDVIICHQKNLIQGDILIDDGIHNFSDTQRFKIIFSAPYNKQFIADQLPGTNYFRCNNWEEVYTVINSLALNQDNYVDQ